MKNYAFLFILFSVLGSTLHAQVKIGGAAEIPHSSAVLELDGGNNRGLLLPRMRKMDIDAIQNPAEGLTIYATDEQAVYVRKSLVWEKQAPFNLPYSAILTSNKGLLKIKNEGIFGASNAIEGFANDGIGLEGGTLRGQGVSGYAYDVLGIAGFFVNNFGGTALSTIGKTGIGTVNPSNLLHINGDQSSGFPVLINDDALASIQLQNGNIDKGYIQADVNDMVLATNLVNNMGKVILRTNNADRLMVDNSGNTGIGAPSVGARLYVDAMQTGADAIIINDQNPILQLQSAGVDKGFIQTNGNDLRLGTNVANTSGNIIMRTKGQDRMRIDSSGRASIGAGNYSQDVSTLNIHGLGLKIDGNDDHPNPYIYFSRTSGNNENALGIITLDQAKMQFAVSNRGYLFSDLSGNEYLGMQATTGYTNIYKRLGISIDNPTAKFHINGIGDAATAMIINDNDPLIQLQQSGVSKGYLQLDNNDIVMAANISNSAGKVIFRTNNIDRLMVDNAGNISIGGTPPPPGYRLAVKGKVAATDFDVVASGSWPDYVFAEGYKLKSLEETDAFIKANKHLPNIPAAAIVEKEGFALGDMQKRMMEKIEELTLHLIAANKATKELSASVVEAKNEISMLKNQIKALDNKK